MFSGIEGKGLERAKPYIFYVCYAGHCSMHSAPTAI